MSLQSFVFELHQKPKSILSKTDLALKISFNILDWKMFGKYFDLF